MSSTADVRVIFKGDSSGATRAVRGLERSFSGLDRAAGVAAKALAIGVAGGLVAATKAAIDFDREMRSVNSIAKLSERQFESLSNRVRGLSKETAKAPSDLARGLYDLVSSGFDANESIKILRVSAKAATAGLTDTKTATKAVAAALNAYHLSADDARKVSDILFQTVNKGVLTFEELAQNMGDLVPAAAPLGVTLEEVGAAIATITLQGVPAAEAATRVKNTMLQLASPSKALSGLLKQNGFESGEAAIKAEGFVGVLQILQKATQGSVTETAKLTPEIRALLGVVGLTGKNFETYEENLQAMKAAQDGAGASAKAFAEQSKSISFQWDKAKASLTAAAIPIGQLLFPALQRGAEALGQFAEGIDRNMPRIRQEFENVSGVVEGFGRIAKQVATTDLGQAGLVGSLTTLLSLNVAGKFIAMRAAFGGLLGPVGLLAAGIGIVAGAFFYASQRTDGFGDSLERLKNAMSDQTDARRALENARVRDEASERRIEAARLGVERATRNVAEMEKRYGKNSLEARDARSLLAQSEEILTQERRDAKRAAEDVQREEQRLTETIKESTAARRDARKEAQSALASINAWTKASGNNEAGARATAKALAIYGRKIQEADSAAGNAVGSANRYAAAVNSLFNQLQRLPTLKEIRIYVTQINRRVGPGLGGDTGRGGVQRATGGFIPMIPGAVAGQDSVPAMLTPGEIVLNTQQQNVLGGPRFLADLFGFSGSRGPGFAGGGIVGGGFGGAASGSKKGPHRPLRPRRPYARSSKAARTVLAAVENVNQRQTNLDRSYGQLNREYDISVEEFILTDAEGNESLDAAAVSKRLGEIDSLAGHRRQMLDLIAEEERKLNAAIRALERAIEDLLAEIKREQAAAQADARAAASMARELSEANNRRGQIDRAIELERRKEFPGGKKGEAARKASRAAISGMEDQRSAVDARIAGIERGIRGKQTSREGHLDKVRSLQGFVADFRGALSDARGNRSNALPYDRRDVELDIMELASQRASITGIKPRAPTATTTTGGGDGGLGIVGGVEDTGALEELRRQIEELTRQLGLANLGLAVQGRQLNVIGSFEKGTIHVPETGPYMLHAGERVLPSGTRDVSGGGGNVIVQISANDKLLDELLSRAIDVRVLRNVSEIESVMGRNIDMRARVGRS